MTSPTGRVYAVVSALLVLFVTWAVISAHPWARAGAQAPDPRLVALRREQVSVHHEAVLARRILARRWAVYHARLSHRRHEIALVEKRHRERLAAARQAAAAAATVSAGPGGGYAAAPSVQVVTLPPLTVTRTS